MTIYCPEQLTIKGDYATLDMYSLGGRAMRIVNGAHVLMPSPRQVLFVGGLLYLGLGYLSGSCLRMVVASVCLLLPAVIWSLALWVSRMFGYLPRMIRIGIIGGSSMLYCLTATSMPAHALFLDRLCVLMLNVVNPISGTASNNVSQLIVATVNIVRALFILYLAIALIGVFNQMQRDEEWQVAARTPLLAVVIVGIIEAISSLVTNANGQCAA